MKEKFFIGDTVLYKKKVGIFLGRVKHKPKYGGEQLAYVHFMGNKLPSKVFYRGIIPAIEHPPLQRNHKSPFGLWS